MKKSLDICIISDLHLGTNSCDADALLNYLDSINPKKLILNGDVIDIWSFKKSQFSKLQLLVINKFIKLLEGGCEIIYVTGNHDELIRRYSGFELGKFKIVDKYIFEADGKSHWVFHGDVFDRTTKGYAKIIAQLGGKGYDFLIFLNRMINLFLSFIGREKMSLSKKVKAGVKMAVAWIDNFEKTAAEIAIDQNFDFVICGHIHESRITNVQNEKGSVIYMNSGDWVESLSALEYINGEWSLYHYSPSQFDSNIEDNFDLSRFNQNLANELLQAVS